MSDGASSRKELLAALEGALSVLEEADMPQAPGAAPPDTPLPSLLEQCEARLAGIAARPPAPVRLLNHMACTGGTLISKAIAAMPNTMLMSEIDPLSTLHLRAPRRPFFPTDLIADLRYSPRSPGEETIVTLFLGALGALHGDLGARGLHLVLRDHAHSHYCTAADRFARPTLSALVARILPVRGAVTVRNPLNSFLSLGNNKWLHFHPATFEEYCLRYLDFLDAHVDFPLYRYEDFIARPQEVARQICDSLELPFDPGFEPLMALMALSGDSGRSGAQIAARQRRAVPMDLRAEAADSAAYARLCARLGYDA